MNSKAFWLVGVVFGISFPVLIARTAIAQVRDA